MKSLAFETEVNARPALLRYVFAAAEHIRSHPETTAEAAISLLMCADK
jgi:hypothetical protein